MTDFEVLDMGEVNKALRVEVGPGSGCSSENPSQHDTDIIIKPPLTVDEHEELLQKVGID
jgi:hypothetical protein